MERLEVPVVAEESGKYRHQAAVTTLDAHTVVDGIGEETRELSERQRFGRQ